jgi:nitrite reductase/ring-hydroxylating ferredoxin subunit
MVEKASFLTRPYGAYLHRDVPPPDNELALVGPGTPCGEYMRRFWHPVGFSDELRDLPKKIRILGEDLVIFRDKRGKVGLIEPHCPHRGTSFEYGLVSECGIRCCYHGWLIDCDGKILETPGEPKDSTLKDRLYHGAYPTLEVHGMVFAYMGPPAEQPPFMNLDTLTLPGYRVFAGRRHHFPCNWLQVKDNCMDPAHASFLHTIVSGAQFTPEFGILAELEWFETSAGMVYVASRRVGENIWVRISDFIPPNVHSFPPTWEDGKREKVFSRPYMTNWCVPIDDTNCMNIGFLYVSNDMEVDEERLRKLRASVGQTGERPYEERQRQPGDWDAQVAQRPIAVHALEHLSATDRGIIMLRKLVRDGIRATAAGRAPFRPTPGADGRIATYAQDTVVRIPKAATEEAEVELLRQTGRRVLEGYYVKHPPATVTREALHAVGV